MPKVIFSSDAAEQIVERFEAALGDHFNRAAKATLILEIEDAIQNWSAYISRVVAEGLRK